MTKQARGAFAFFVLLSLIGSLFVFSAAPSEAAGETVTLTPSQGPPGITVTITATGFFDPCVFRWGGPQGSALGKCDANANGVAVTTFNVPNVAPGKYDVWWCSFCGGGEFETTGTRPFTVTAPPTTTTAPTPTTPTTVPPTPTTTSTAPPAPTTTTSGAPTTTKASPTTTRAGTTTSTSATTTSTSTTIPDDSSARPFPGPLPAPSPGAGIPDFAGSGLLGDLDDLFTPFDFEGGAMRFPDEWLLRCGAPPGAHRVDFDDQELGSVPRFEDPTDPDLIFLRASSPQVLAPAHGTITAPHAVAFPIPPSPSIEFDAGAPKFTSASGFGFFGLHIGLAEDIGETVVVELAARRFPASWHDIDRVEIGPNRSPATTCLMVTARDEFRFGEVHFRAYSESGRAVPVIIDSVYWSHDETYPVSPDVEPVELEIFYPSPSIRLPTAHSTPVMGRISWPAGLTLNRVEIASPSWDGASVLTQNAAVGTPTVDGLEATAVFWVHALPVPSGSFEVRATAFGPRLRGSTAVTLEGLGPPTAPATEYEDLVEGEVDVIPWAMEVTQAVRGPLVVQSPGSLIDDEFNHAALKRTVVRGYATHQINADLGIRPGQLMLNAVLHGTRNGVTLPFSPLEPMASPTRVFGFDPGSAAEGVARPFASNTFNFVLPYQWTEAGDPIELRLEVNSDSSPNHIEEVPGRDGWANTISQRVEFLDTGRVGLGVVNVEFHWRCTEDMVSSDDDAHPCRGQSVGDPVSSQRTETEIRNGVQGWWKTIPARGDFPSYLNFSEVKIPHMNDDPVISVDRAITGRASALAWTSLRDAYWNLYCGDDVDHIIQPPTSRDFIWMTTPPWTPLTAGCGIVGVRSAFRASTYWGTVAQEAGHTAGMEHAGNSHGEIRGGSAMVRFTPDHGQIDPPGQPTWGFDTTNSMVVTPGTGGHVHDYMSYGGGANWTGVDTWDHMFAVLYQNRMRAESRGTVYLAADGEAAALGETGEEAAVGEPGEGPALIVKGTISPDGGLSLEPARIGDASTFQFIEGNDVEVTIETVDGESLTRGAALVAEATHNPSDSKSFVVAFPPDLEPSLLSIDPTEFEVMTVEPVGTGIPLEIAEASPDLLRWDPGDAAPPFTVEVSEDGGETWWSLGTTEESSLSLSDGSAPMAGDGWMVRVQGADGPHVHFDTSPIDFGTPTPVASIGSPLDGERVPVGVVRAYAVVPLFGEDGTTYRWSVNGSVMNEGEVADLPVMPGDNTITLHVENEAGVSESSIAIMGVFDSDGDGLDDEWEEQQGLDPLARDLVEEDVDEDGLALAEEYRLQTDPSDADTDGDGDSDGLELIGAGDPLDPTLGAGPIHGDADASAAAAGSESALPHLPLWVLVVGGALLLAPIVYWIWRTRVRSL